MYDSAMYNNYLTVRYDFRVHNFDGSSLFQFDVMKKEKTEFEIDVN